MIRMEHVSKKFGEKTVLRDVSLELADGGRVAVEGPSGCGKTTLLNIMMGLLPQDAGNILRSNVDKMAAVFQEDRLIEHMSPQDNIRIAAKGISPESIASALSRVGLDQRDQKSVRHMSGGQRRRVAIVRAALARPQLLLLDEPFQGLDEEARKKTAAFLLDECPNAAMVLVSHDAQDANLMKISEKLRLSCRGPGCEG